MKKTRRFARFILPLALLACFSGVLSAAPYGPKGREIKWVQPDGEKLTLRVFGDDFYARTETEDGYTVVYNQKDGAYHYAEVADNGKTLKPSGARVRRQAPGGLDKHIELPKEQIRELRIKNLRKLDIVRGERWSKRVEAFRQLDAARNGGNPALSGEQLAAARIAAAPVLGKKVGLTILVEFPDDPSTGGKDPVDFPTTRAKVIRYCNQDGYTEDGNTGSVRDYFFDQSQGRMTYTQSVTQIVKLPNPRDYYNFDDYPANTTFRDPGSAGEEIIVDAIASLKADGFDFTNLTVDADRNALATNVFYAGPDSGVWANGLWPHSGSLNTRISVGTPTTPVFLNAYQITNIENSRPVIGTFCHENGHLLMDYPDLYSYVGEGEGVGDHCLMGGGNYNNDGKTPSPIDAFLKDVVGWATMYDLAVTDYVSKTLPTTGNVAYRIRKPGSTTESFYVENRGNGDKWAQYAVDKGIMVWHIDETIDGNSNRFGTDPHYGVSLEQADGSFNLENGANRGDTSDLFDTIYPLFSDATTPSSKWWDGSDSSVRVKVLSGVGANTKVQFGKLPPNTIILDSPNGGEVMYRQSKFMITWEANVIGNLKIDLLKGGTFYANIAADAQNTGSYEWEIPGSMAAGKNYTIRISTLTNPVAVNDVSNAKFQITDATFPPGNQMPYGWVKPADADGGWEVTKSSVYEGTHSLASKPIGDGRKAAVSYTSNFKAGTLSFYMKVSSETGYDYASFYLDGVRQVLPAATSNKGITGRTQWGFASYPISAGTHTFMWVYTKDDSYGEGKDTAWVDGVQLPPTTQEIVVKNPAGISLTSGDSTTVFDKQRIGNSSKAKIFTIRNSGKAPLHGLKIVTKGGDPGSFVVGALGKTALAPGQQTTFSVKFAPSKPGLKDAEIRIRSNDENEDPFVIGLAGLALGIPEIAVFQPDDNKLKDGKSLVNFGYSTVGIEGKTKTFVVKNTGNAPMTGLEVSKSGPAKGDYSIRAIGSTRLAPGESTTFKVTFSPKKKDDRSAQIHVTCDYKKAGSFDVNLKGTGAPKNLGKSDIVSAADADRLIDAVAGLTSTAQGGVISSEIIDGNKFLTLTVTKPAVNDGMLRIVEVSPNLVDWYSGSKHTTTISDNESFLKVRDNTPVTPGVKRYIRLKTTKP